jgi:hypothetical protein
MPTSRTSRDNYGSRRQLSATRRQTAALREAMRFGIKE